MSDDEVVQLKAILLSALDRIEGLQMERVSLNTNIRDVEILIRRARMKYFPINYFADAAWDILLDLDLAERQGSRYSVTDLGVDVNLPLTTTLRYLSRMESDGFIAKEASKTDRRRTQIALTDAGRFALNQTFDSVSTEKLKRLQSSQTGTI
jgi:DNA-binding MarR family transcriptional regulator